MRQLYLLVFAFVFLPFEAPASADSITIEPLQDNTIYADNTSNSNGAGDFIFAGQNGGASPRRALIAFDLTAIPANAQIDSVTLNLFASQTGSSVAANIGLHRLVSNWGESNSDAPGGEGGGTAAQNGDATWDFTFFDTQSWVTPGGDFVAGASATTVVDVNGPYSWSSSKLVGDVQNWVDGTENNFGWILIGDETAAGTSKRFNSRDNGSLRPALMVEFSVVPEPNTAAVICATSVLFRLRRRR